MNCRQTTGSAGLPTYSFIIILFFVMPGCKSSKLLLEKVSEPRSGSPINNKLALVYSSRYQISLYKLEKLHPFDINKYAHIYLQLVTDSLITPEDIYVPEPLNKEQILTVHNEGFLKSLESSRIVAEYLEAPLAKILPSKVLGKGVLKPFLYASGGTLEAARQALKYGAGINIGGGYHHAKPHKGEGFCIYADVPIAIRILQQEGMISKALIIDLDVHQGNGTALIFENDETVFTFSMHQGDIYPVPKENSDLDIELSAGTGDSEYLEILTNHVPRLFELSKPDIVFIIGGCDTLKDDPLASLNMTEEGIVRRDWTVINACIDYKIPVVMTLAGGYSDNAWHAQYSSIKNIIENINNM
ncbi:MAG: histone deacetylase [Candidatus Zixiibacteriota bacterium]|nr:MAG: histone deacetylase [candidate division Zixibacteria bacterium]